jgi:hypothetical protein
MIFIVSDKCKGSLSLNSLQKIVKSGSKIAIDSSKILCPDVQAAIANQILIPLEEKEYKNKYKNVSPEAIIVNKTNKIMVLGNIVLRPQASLTVDKSFTTSFDVVQAKKQGYIDVVSKKEDIKVTPSQPDLSEPVDSIPEEKAPLRGEDRPVTPQVWDFREKKAVNAVVVPKSEDVTVVDNEEDKKEEKDASIGVVKEKTKTKAGKNKKDKKGKPTKIQKGKAIKPVGENRPEKTSMEAQMDLDEQGHPINKVADAMRDIIKKVTGDDISFVDTEQAVERAKQRKVIE